MGCDYWLCWRLPRRLAAVSKTLRGGLSMEIACVSRRWCGSGRMEKAWGNLARFCWRSVLVAVLKGELTR